MHVTNTKWNNKCMQCNTKLHKYNQTCVIIFFSNNLHDLLHVGAILEWSSGHHMNCIVQHLTDNLKQLYLLLYIATYTLILKMLL